MGIHTRVYSYKEAPEIVCSCSASIYIWRAMNGDAAMPPTIVLSVAAFAYMFIGMDCSGSILDPSTLSLTRVYHLKLVVARYLLAKAETRFPYSLYRSKKRSTAPVLRAADRFLLSRKLALARLGLFFAALASGCAESFR